MHRTMHMVGRIDDEVMRRLWRFLVASLCVHAALLFAIARNSAPGVVDGTRSTLSFTVSFVESTPAQPPARSEPGASKHVHPPKQTALVKAAPAPIQTRSPKPADAAPSPEPLAPTFAQTTPPSTVAADESVEANAAGSANDTKAARESAWTQVRTLLLTDLARRFTYPALAQRRGWQGMVLLSVTVKPNGALERIHVSQSSGYDVLDRSAVDTMRRVGQLAEARQWLGWEALELLLPIVYRLTD